MSERAEISAQPSSAHARREDRGATAKTAHDLCNQLQVIESALNLIHRAIHADASSALNEVFGFARLALDRAGRLSRRLVDTTPERTDTTCRVSIAERLAALPELALLASASNILIDYRVHDDVPDVLCDPDALADAILNIVVNARRAMPGGGRILITAVREIDALEGLPLAVLRIADTGCGMSPEIAARAFEPKFTTRAAGEGSGLGLAMVAEFARAAGGVAELESKLCVGTVITLRLPSVMKPVLDVRRYQ
ncbi:sensor histidine kinase [Sphingomonas sp. UYP23]